MSEEDCKATLEHLRGAHIALSEELGRARKRIEVLERALKELRTGISGISREN